MIHFTELRHSVTIHTTGAIQPHGVLVALRESDWTILQVSNNAKEFFGIESEELLSRSLDAILNSEQLDAIQHCIQTDIPSLKLSIQDRLFDAIVHRTNQAVILELEPIQGSETVSPHLRVRSAIAALQKTTTIQDFLQQVVEQIQAITQFDRVHVFQFDHQGAGSVIAEVRHETVPSYLGLHYPAIDIPDESRELYLKGLLRFVPDIHAPSVPLNAQDELELDLGLAVLRSVDPCCVDYHRNLNVAAFFVIALVKDQQLWGLISCHNQTPKHLNYDLRSTCELLGQFISLELASRIDQAELEQFVRLKTLQSDFIESIAQVDSLRDALINPQPRLLDLVGAHGAAVCLETEITRVGTTPTKAEIAALIEWAESEVGDSLFHTDALPKLYPIAEAFKESASGLLLLQISKVRRYYVLWFRPEVIQMVNWAGNPNDAIAVNSDGEITLSARSSFERWQETVRGTSLPWKPYELNNALDLRTAIVGIVLKKADELTQINLALEQSNRELDSFAFAASHDLKEPLRGIYNNAVILLEDYAIALDEDGLDSLQTILRLAQRMETLVNTLLQFSQLGNVELQRRPTDLNELLRHTIEMLQASRVGQPLEIRVPRSLPTVACDPALMGEVFSNLLSNAFKYNRNPQPWAEVGFELQESSESYLFYIRDNGIGIRSHHLDLIFKLFKRLHAQEEYGGGTGAGLTIARKIIDRHGGQLWVESTYGEGSTFYFCLN